MKLTIKAALAVVGIAASGCAARPESIQPSYVSTMVYQNWTCAQLVEEDGRLHAAYLTAAGQQNHARKTDTVGVLLLGLPVGSMTGENVAPQVASLRGQMEAVNQSETLKNCSHESQTLSNTRPYVGAAGDGQPQTPDH